ncbi:MAG: ribbon-helix-helix domain-containing protein [Candidatus Pacearchaeota archaeon]|jgi:metal-responsive CopG/Arc/MetJ family transcriptional regulator
METISLKLEKAFLQEIEKVMKKHNYTTKTEFIREAIRDKLKELGEKEPKPVKSEPRKEQEPRPVPSYI